MFYQTLSVSLHKLLGVCFEVIALFPDFGFRFRSHGYLPNSDVYKLNNFLQLD